MTANDVQTFVNGARRFVRTLARIWRFWMRAIGRALLAVVDRIVETPRLRMMREAREAAEAACEDAERTNVLLRTENTRLKHILDGFSRRIAAVGTAVRELEGHLICDTARDPRFKLPPSQE